MENFIVGLIIVIIFSGAIYFIVSAKRKGVKCIGCPHGGSTECNSNKVQLKE